MNEHAARAKRGRPTTKRAPNAGPTDRAKPTQGALHALQAKAGNGAVSDLLRSAGPPTHDAPDASSGPRAVENPGFEAQADRAASKARSLPSTPDPRQQLDGAPIANAHRGALARIAGGDVSGVRLHTGPKAQRSADDLGAQAFTAGRDIHFGPGAYDPGSRTGFGLLAHEVTHAVKHPSDGQLVHAKLKGSAEALASMGGSAKKSLYKKLHASRWNALLSEVAKYEKLEAEHETLLRDPKAKGYAKKEQRTREKLQAALVKMEKTAFEWQQANDQEGADAIVAKARGTQRDAEGDDRTKAPRRQAVALFLVRLRTEARVLAGGGSTSSPITDANLTLSEDSAVGGGMNRLDKVAYASDSGEIVKGYFKAEKGFESTSAGHDRSVGIAQHDPNYGARSLAMYRLDKLLQGGVIARTEFAVHTSRDLTKNPDTGKDEFGPATTKLGFFTEEATGRAMSEYARDDQVAVTKAERLRSADPSAMIDTEDPVLQSAVNKLQILDAIAGQLDRHAGNWFVDRDDSGKVRGITGIDNDMAFGANMTSPDHPSAKGAFNYLGMPELVDEAFGQRLLQVRDADIRDVLDGLLTPTEVEATVSRFNVVKQTVQQLAANDKLTKTWDADSAAAQRHQTEKGRWGAAVPSMLGEMAEGFWAYQREQLETGLRRRGWSPQPIKAVMTPLSTWVHENRLERDQIDAVVAHAAKICELDPEWEHGDNDRKVDIAARAVRHAKKNPDTSVQLLTAMGKQVDQVIAAMPAPASRTAASPDAAPAPLAGDRTRIRFWPTPDAKALDPTYGDLKTLPAPAAKDLRKRAGKIRSDAAALWKDISTKFADHPEWLDHKAMRVDVPWTSQMLTEFGLPVGGSFGLPHVEDGVSASDAANAQINAAGLARERNRQLASDIAGGADSYDDTYDDFLLDELEDKLRAAAKDEQIKSVLESTDSEHEGFIISESHGDESSWKYLYEQMNSLKSQGVMTLYLEHFRHSEYQPILDAYFADADADMSPILASYIRKFDEKHTLKGNHSLMGVVAKAKAEGLRIVGIDDAGAKMGADVTPGDKLESRAARMNVLAEAIVARDQATFGKHRFVMMMGAKHTHDHTVAVDDQGRATSGFDQGIAGVAQLLNLLAVRVDDESNMTLHKR